MNTIVYPRERFLSDYRSLRQQDPEAGRRVGAGLCCSVEGVAMLVPPSDHHDAPARSLWLQLTGHLRSAPALPNGVDAALFLGQGRELGQARGLIRMEAGEVESVGALDLPGPGMERIALTASPQPGHPLSPGGGEGARRAGAAEILRLGGRKQVRPDERSLQEEPANANEMFSRVEGALGSAVWRRLTRLRFAVIGAGRLGGGVAVALAHEGARDFALIDPDVFEHHNIGGGLAGTSADVGQSKVRVVADALRAVNPEIQVIEVARSVTHFHALEAIKSADFVVSASDHDSARLACAWLAALYLKPLLDVGTGVFREGGRREIGADARLVWPGRCLLCDGGLRAEQEARRVLASAEAERLLKTASPDWRHGRAGSLTSLNAAAGAGLAVRMIEDFVEGALVENGAWTRLEFGSDARLRVRHLGSPAPADAACCCRFAGLGDDGLAEVVKEISRAAEQNGTAAHPVGINSVNNPIQ